MKTCPNCGFSIENDAVFCGNCGFSIEALTQTPMQASVEPQQIPDQPPVSTPKKNKTTLFIVLIIIGILLISAGVFFVLEATNIINFLDKIGDNRDVSSSEIDSTFEESQTDKDGNIISDKTTETVWIFNGGKSENSKYEIIYDDNYRIISATRYNRDNEIEFCDTFTYDSDGSLMSEKYLFDEFYDISYEYTYDSKGRLQSSYVIDKEEGVIVRYTINYTCDDEGNVLTSDSIYEGEDTPREKYTYDKNGNTLSETHYENGKESSRIEYTYDESDNILSEIHYENDEEYYRVEYTYDSMGNMLSEIDYYDDTEANKWLYTYDTDGNKLSYVQYFQNEESFRREYTYSSDGNMLTETKFYMGEKSSYSKYSYDSAGNVSEVKTYSTDDIEVSSEKYTYDDNGNMLTHTIKEGGTVEEKTENTYDEHGNLITEIITYSSGETIHVEYSWSSVELPPEQAEALREEMSLYLP